jgi:pilus assembly protein Flp/PilA
MQVLHNTLLDFWQEESGLTIVEYALAGALIAAVAITALTKLGTGISTKLGTITAAL